MNQPHTPVFLLPFSPPTAHFVGRQDELQTLHAHLQAGKHTILVNGLGGVGKTTLAQKYVQEYQNEYVHILWVRQGIHLIGSFFQKELFDNVGLDVGKEETAIIAFRNVLAKLRKLQGANLLVIDNYEPTETDQTQEALTQLFALPTTWRVLCTSRTDADFFDETLRLDVLPAPEAVRMFQEYAKGKPTDATEVGELLKMIGYHTLMTELLAKTYKQCPQFLTVGKMHAYLKERSLQDQQLAQKIHIGTQATTLYTHLHTVFSLASLTEDELWVLKQWAVLPTAPHQAMDFLTWIQDTDLAYQPILLSLTEKGWLQTNDRLAYALHPFLQLFLHQELKPTLPDCYKMYKYFMDLMDIEKIQANPLVYQYLIPIGEALTQNVNFSKYEQKLGNLLNYITQLHRLSGDFTKAINCAKQDLTIKERTLGKKHEHYATVLNNLAALNDEIGNNIEALLLFQEALEIRRKVLNKQHPHIAISLNSLAIFYSKQKMYLKALPLLEESLQIYEQNFGKQHPYYATSLNNLALLYDNQQNYAKALSLYQEALQIRKEVLGERHPDTAISLRSIGTLYFEQGDYQQARTYLVEAYSIRFEKLGEQHPDTQSTKKWLDKLPRTTSKQYFKTFTQRVKSFISYFFGKK